MTETENHPIGVDQPGDVVMMRTVERGPTEAEIAQDLKRRTQEVMKPMLALLDEAAAAGLSIRWDAILPSPPYYRHSIVNLRVEKHY